MEVPVIIFIVVALIFGSIGFLRGYQPSQDNWMWFGIMILVSLVGAGMCWIIGSTKSGYMLAGIIGMIMSYLLLAVAATLGIGGLIGGLARRIIPARCQVDSGHIRQWDVFMIVIVSGGGVFLSLMESGGSY